MLMTLPLAAEIVGLAAGHVLVNKDKSMEGLIDNRGMDVAIIRNT